MANGLYAAIAEGGKPIQLENPLNQMARVATIRGAEQEQQLNAMRLREAEIGARESESLRNYLSGVTDVSSPNVRARLTTGFGRTGLGYVKQLSEVEKGNLEAQTKRFDLIKNKTNYYRDALATVNTPEDAQLWTAAVYNDSILGPTVANLGGNLEQALARIPRDPAQFAQWRQQTALGAQKFIELNAPKTVTQDVGGATQVLAIPGLGGGATVVPGSRAEKTMAPGEAERIRNEGIRIGQEGRRLAIQEENQRREADPEFQRRMEVARTTGRKAAEGEVAAQRQLPGAIARAEEGLRLIDELVGKRDAKGNLVKGAQPYPGFETAVGATWLPGARFVPGSPAAGFMSRYNQIKGASFLEAFESLKGGGAITEKEGAKATDAINRMDISTSEAEFVLAAQDLKNVINKGIETAKRRGLGIGAPAAGAPAPASTPAPATGGARFLGFE